MKSRYMQEMTWRQIQEYLNRSDVAIIPIGSNEVHGALLPQGSDTSIAEAVSLKLAERIDALIAPPIFYTYSGGTKNIIGTISLKSDIVYYYLESIILELIRNKFRRIYLIQWHAPYYSHQQLAREVFEKTKVPVVFFGLMDMPVVCKMQKELLERKIAEIETPVVSAALKILGKEYLLDTSIMSENQDTKNREEENILKVINGAGGVVGHYYTDESQHVAFSKELNIDYGLAIINTIVDIIAETADSLRKYVNILSRANK